MSESTFAGFVPPTRNYFMMPNEWTDITAEIDSLAELKVVEYVLRHTWGFHEFGICKTISVDEFMHGRKYRTGERAGERMDKGTGLKSDRSVKDGIKLAIEHGYLVCQTDGSDQARIRKSYALKMRNDNNLPARGVDSTSQVNTTPGRNHPSDPHLLPLGDVNSTPRSKKDTKEKHFEKERETQPPVPPTTPQRNSLSLSPEKSSLMDRLTNQETDFWARWCAIAGMQELNEAAYKWVTDLAPKTPTIVELQSLYDYDYERLQEFAKAQGRTATPPNLCNLAKRYNEWRTWYNLQKKERDQEAHEHIPGSGSITNWTQARLAGNQPVINYEPLPPVHKIPKDLKKAGDVTKALSPGLQERIRQAREKRQAEA